MARYQILYWKEVPSVVEARDETGTVKLQLGDRFQGLIDAVAMRLGLAGTEEYLDQWDHGQERRFASAAPARSPRAWRRGAGKSIRGVPRTVARPGGIVTTVSDRRAAAARVRDEVGDQRPFSIEGLRKSDLR